MGIPLISVDGIPGSGKSTTATWLAEMLTARGKNVKLIGEDQYPHPTRFLTELRHPLSPWREINGREFSAGSLAKFEKFINLSSSGDDRVIIIDGLLFHTDSTTLFLMQGADVTYREHLAGLFELASTFHFLPLLLCHRPYAVHLPTVFEIRPPGWSAMQIGWKTSSPYCRTMGFTGRQGYLDMYGEYERTISRIFDKQVATGTKGLAISNPHLDWKASRKHIWDFYSRELLVPDMFMDLFGE